MKHKHVFAALDVHRLFLVGNDELGLGPVLVCQSHITIKVKLIDLLGIWLLHIDFCLVAQP